MVKVDNAIILAAGFSSRFAPLSFEKPKALIEVREEVLIERQIRQLREAGIQEIIVVTGYKADMFDYLKEKFDIKILFNPEFNNRNNHSSLYVAKDYLSNSYICSADNYFLSNPFQIEVADSYYATQFSKDRTQEWCVSSDQDNYISKVNIGGENSWYMIGHTFWRKDFSDKFLSILGGIYQDLETKDLLWEDIYIKHLDVLRMKCRRYMPNIIFEFDSMEELKLFDNSYIKDSKSSIIKKIAKKFNIKEQEIIIGSPLKSENNVIGFIFSIKNTKWTFIYKNQAILPFEVEKN